MNRNEIVKTWLEAHLRVAQFGIASLNVIVQEIKFALINHPDDRPELEEALIKAIHSVNGYKECEAEAMQKLAELEPK